MTSVAAISDLLPNKLQTFLLSDSEIAPRTIPVVSEFEKWFDASGTPFFKKYTDHSSKHSLDVFRSSCEFLSSDSYDIISSKDLCLLLIACFCHDAGMHLTEPQFMALITQKSIYSPELDRDSWADLWVEYLGEAKRFSRKKTIDLFGDEVAVTTIPDKSQDFTDRHRLLVGEFIRRHHPRLAHDLCKGLDSYIGLGSLFTGLTTEERDIVGLVARSHGCSLRSLFSYIEAHYDLRDFNNIHIVFVMCLLCIADYTQLQSSRAPVTREMIHVIESPISRREWRVHRSIKNINLTHSDPESIFVDAEPMQVDDYLRLSEWLEGIQRSLDNNWAILGEVYGRYSQNRLERLRLSLRRVRSSLSEKKHRFRFLPEKITFRVAEAEMLALLLQPLYGDHPGYGVRELIQNAVDAVREAKFLDLHKPSDQIYDVKVTLSKLENKGVFSIADSGVGMNARILKDYFLNAGASFRSSKEWRNAFIGENNELQVIRNGRFGVGALAAFLIGDRISVDTQSSSSPQEGSYHFEAGLYDEYISVEHGQRYAGTSVEIAVNQMYLETLIKYFQDMRLLYYFEDVKVFCEIDLDGNKTSFYLDQKPTEYYFDKSTISYERVLIGSTRDDNRNVPDFINGIAIKPLEEKSYANRIASLQPIAAMPFPFTDQAHLYTQIQKSFSVVDRNGFAPLNLARNQFTRPDPEITDLIADIAFEELSRELQPLSNFESNYSSYGEFFLYDRSTFIYDIRGMMPLDLHLMNEASIEHIICLPNNQSIDRMTMEQFPQFSFVFGSGLTADTSPTNMIYYLRQIRQSQGNIRIGASFSLDYIAAVHGLATIPMWLKSILANLLEDENNRHVLTFGGIEDEILRALLTLKSDSELNSFTYISSSRWQRSSPTYPTREPQIGELALRWRDAFEKTGGFFR